jgi:alpha-L-rhamnosidase
MNAKILFFFLAAAFAGRALASGEPVSSPLAVSADTVGASLQQTMVWANAKPQSQFVAFRRSFNLPGTLRQATLHLFADARYLLWINGRYVSRGPARFEPTGPEYDSMEVSRFLQSGNNTLVVLVMADGSNGKMRHHVPGLTARLDAGGGDPLLVSDAAWKWSDRTRYQNAHIDWGNTEDQIDARAEDGDWTQPAYDDHTWKSAARIDGHLWGPLSARRIPLLRETEVNMKLAPPRSFPVTLAANQKLEFTTDHLVQAYTVLELEAEAGSELSLDYAGIKYVARAGRQTYLSSDTHGFFGGSITVKSGRVTIQSLKLVERLYPFDVAGSFKSNDEALNKLWALCARSCQVFSEDSYVDCADRERTEWMDDDPPAFDVTRTAMAGPKPGGGPLYSDPRLLEELLRRTALTVQPDGWVKAHTCSDRFDIHAKMEDRECDWVEGARRYYESTGNPAIIREIWPVIVRQMNYFLARRTPRGLVLAREWEVWGNPIGYVTCEGAGVNAFIYKALVDAAYLGNAIGEKPQAAEFDSAARDLAVAFNQVLWNEKDGTYNSGYTENYEKAKDGRKVDVPIEGNLIAPTMFPALFALDQGIVPAARRARVVSYLLANRRQSARIMTDYYLFKQLYGAGTDALDREVLQTLRAKWAGMIAWPWHTTWEEFDGGSKAHIYGMFPGYFLSAYVLGVRLDGPVWQKRLLIEPRLGDLTSAEGVVVTEHGPVPVSWKMSSDHLDFQFTVPDGVTASLRLPSFDGKATLVLDKHAVTSSPSIEVKAGFHQGTLNFPAGENTFSSMPKGKNFTDDFTHGNTAWQETGGIWKVDSGSYVQSEASASAITGVKDLSWSDAAYEFTCQIMHSDDSANWAGFGFRKPAPDSKHDDGGYLVYLRENGDLDLFAGKVLKSVKTGLNTSKPIKFKVVAKGDHIEVYLNQESSPRIDVHDDTYSDGFIGFETAQAQAAFGPIAVGTGG